MKRKHWIWIGVALAAYIVVVMLLVILSPRGQAANPLNLGKINELADYLNDKYGYDLTADDCVFYMRENYDSRGSGLTPSSHYDIPYVAAFDVDGKRIIATDRKGFLSDDGQLDQLSDLLCGYYMEKTGLTGLEYVDIRGASHSRIAPPEAGDILQKYCNVLLTEENIGEFVDALFEYGDNVEIAFYFREAEDREQQMEEITQKLKLIDIPESMVILEFYTILGDEPLHIIDGRIDLNQFAEKSETGTTDFHYGAYYINNPYSMGFKSEDSFGYRGYYSMDKGYSFAAFGVYNDYKFEVNGWTMADLTEEVPGSEDIGSEAGEDLVSDGNEPDLLGEATKDSTGETGE